jgi:pimeloyl-ACP methyl ester carboxylesterase
LIGGIASVAAASIPFELFKAASAAEPDSEEISKESMKMDTVTTKDGTKIFFKDWGSGQPIVFHHGWPLTADDWDAQMMFFLQHGYRVIAHDRRGHGRSTQTATGNDMDTYPWAVVNSAHRIYAVAHKIQDYAWDARAAYVIGTRHREDYHLFVPRELAPDMVALTGQIMRQREDKGSSLRFEAAGTHRAGQDLAANSASQKMRAALEKGREALTAAQAERAQRFEELRKAREQSQTLSPGRGKGLGR